MTRHLQAIIDTARDQDDLIDRLVKLGVKRPAAFARLLAEHLTATDLHRALADNKPVQKTTVH